MKENLESEKPITISLCMIVKNEEDVIGRCLKSVEGLFDEIIIVDTGSTDKTKEIARQYTDKIFDFEWVNDFSKARNYSFSLSNCEYIMWLDADDILPIKERSKFIKLKEILQKEKPDAVMMKYDIAFDENGKSTFSYFRERILKRSAGFVWQDPVHEVISLKGKILHSEISIEHHKIEEKRQTDRNLKIYESLIEMSVKLSARQMYYYSRELMYNNLFEKAIENYKKFLLRTDAWIENKLSAYKDMSYCYLKLNDAMSAKKILLESLQFGRLDADICCKIGDLFLYEKKYKTASIWYELALKDKMNLKSGAFIEPRYYNVYPLLQLTVCYYYLGETKKAEKCNSKVGKIEPKNESYLKNKEIFEKNNIKN
ncbi:MAG: glycosyltransferase family 2 protein [Clostridiales bacterium]|nr:glycosyltransferase family 2 protein [Candidatus Apopatousia equi]